MDDYTTSLIDQLDSGKLLNLSTTDGDQLRMCSVWYALSSDRRVIYFTSKDTRLHSANIRANGRVSGGIVSIALEGLGQKTQGVFLSGSAVEVEGDALQEAYESYRSKWPQVQ